MQNLIFDYWCKYKPKSLTFIGKKTEDETTGKNRLNGFIKACKKLEISYKWILIENNLKAVEKVFPQLKPKENVICGTHTIFKSLIILSYNKPKFTLTDIGYNTTTDYYKKYRFKVFIDYFFMASRFTIY